MKRYLTITLCLVALGLGTARPGLAADPLDEVTGTEVWGGDIARRAALAREVRAWQELRRFADEGRRILEQERAAYFTARQQGWQRLFPPGTVFLRQQAPYRAPRGGAAGRATAPTHRRAPPPGKTTPPRPHPIPPPVHRKQPEVTRGWMEEEARALEQRYGKQSPARTAPPRATPAAPAPPAGRAGRSPVPAASPRRQPAAPTTGKPKGRKATGVKQTPPRPAVIKKSKKKALRDAGSSSEGAAFFRKQLKSAPSEDLEDIARKGKGYYDDSGQYVDPELKDELEAGGEDLEED